MSPSRSRHPEFDRFEPGAPIAAQYILSKASAPAAVMILKKRVITHYVGS